MVTVNMNNDIAVENLNEDVKELYSEKVKNFINDIYELRKDSIAKEGEFGLGNLVFKEFRNLGYLDSLKELRKQLKGQELSLEHLQDNVVCETIIKSNTPYMLRNDGILLECGATHPYIKIYQEYDYDKNLKEFLKHENYLSWFKENSKNEKTLELLNKFESLEDKTTKEAEDIFNELHRLTSDEFCKVRTSNIKYAYGGDNGEIYFRISSEDFNWFDLIWNVVMQNKESIKAVTVVKDKPFIGNAQEYYVIGDKKLSHLPVEEFLTLSGNPVIENLDIIEELNKTNSKRLFKLLKTVVGMSNLIISSDVEKEILDKKAYDKTKKLISKGIKAQGAWKDEKGNLIEQPDSYVVKATENKAKSIAKDLCQNEFILVTFTTPDKFSAQVYRTVDDKFSDYKKLGEPSSSVVFDKDVEKLDGYTSIDGNMFSLGIYGNEEKNVFKALTEDKDDDIIKNDVGEKQNMHKLHLENARVRDWFEYYKDIHDWSDEEIIKSYGTKEELSGEANYYAELYDNDKKIAELNFANFEGIGSWAELGVSFIESDELKNALRKIGYEEDDGDGLENAEFVLYVRDAVYDSTAEEVLEKYVKEIEDEMNSNRVDEAVDIKIMPKEEENKITFDKMKELANKLSEHLTELGRYYDVYPEEDSVSVDIEWGDWKHDHLWLKQEAKKFFSELNEEVKSIEDEITEEDGSDTYSAIHTIYFK